MKQFISLISLLFLTILPCKGQNNDLFRFIGKRVLLSNQVNASNIHKVDSNNWNIKFQFDNYYNIDDLKEYKIGLIKPIHNTLLKFNYFYFQENIFVTNTFKIGIQKKLGNRLVGNIALANQTRTYQRSETTVFAGMALNYRLTNQIFIHSLIDNIGFTGNRNNLMVLSGIIYKVNNSLGFIGQLENNTDYEFSLGGSFSYKRFQIQLIHSILQETLSLSLELDFYKYNLAFSYYHHPILQQNITIFLGFNL